MERATPIQMRKALEAAEALRIAGVRFVPMPVINDEDHDQLIEQAEQRLDQMIQLCDEDHPHVELMREQHFEGGY